jgi:hypothetical protein
MKIQQQRSIALQIAVTGIFLLTLCGGCRRQATIETVSEQIVLGSFDPLTNWHADSSGKDIETGIEKKSIYLDYTNTLDEGFVIPAVSQVKEGQFEFSFEIRNTGKTPARFFYKIFYQNESYKFPETDEHDSTLQNLNCWENFYGSWEPAAQGFRETPVIPVDNDFHMVTDRFRITGNPRDEKRYFTENRNDRWKRNPRVGDYSFLLVVTAAENLQKNIPMAVQDISQLSEGSFINPYYYFLYGPGKKLPNTVIRKSASLLKVIAKPDPGAGIYVGNEVFNPAKATKYYCKTCGTDPSLYRSAAFEQFGHYIDPGTKFNNIPVIEDVLEDYTKMDYNWNSRFFTKEELIAITPSVSKDPCRSVSSDPEEHKIIIRNPGCEYGKWAKENVGVRTRHGFTYGKWTLKAKLTNLLSRDNVWNGITNAIWLLTQDQAEWNFRRDCNKEGYMANYYGGKQDERVKSMGYSEIDFEILKTVPYCPSYLLPPVYNYGIDDPNHVSNWNVAFPAEITDNDNDIMVCTTNWDMACWEPADFKDGCQPVAYKGQTFLAHRWDKTYRALTEKVPEPDRELFGSPYYYFQIDWEPTEIIWRIGPSKDKLRVVGYMSADNTSIPNNQMLLLITQEFHNTRWWVGSMYQQDNIPFPQKDYVGEIYELTIE